MVDGNDSSIDAHIPLLTRNIHFWSYLVILIPSILCSLFNLYHFLVDRTLRNSLNNHVITIVLLIGLFYEITIYPWMLYYYHFQGVWERSNVFCSIWGYIDWTFYILQTMLFAWATIERYILIFHDCLVSTKRKRFFFHYLPIIILIIYNLIFYIIVYFFVPCENLYSTAYMRCVYFCINDDYGFYLWETIGHQILPGLIIIIFSSILFARIIWKKASIHQQIQWRRHQKMAMQLLAISLNYIIFYFPYILLNFMSLCGRYYDLSEDFRDFLDFLSYFMMLFLPLVCILTLPDSSKRMKRILRCTRRSHHIVPTTVLTK